MVWVSGGLYYYAKTKLRGKHEKCPPNSIVSMKIQNWPAAAVIPAPIAYIKVVAVKKLVVEPWTWLICPPNRAHGFGRVFPSGEPYALHWV